MSTGKLTEIYNICNNFPQNYNQALQRDHILNSFETIFEGDTKIIILEGPDGIGKTTILAQFFIKHSDRTIAVFIKGSSKFTYDPYVIKSDIMNQIEWMIKKNELSPEVDLDEHQFQRKLYDLARYARKSNTKVYFIIDGYDELSVEDKSILGVIIGLLPIGTSNFNFIISGNYDEVIKYIPKGVIIRPYQVPGFTVGETEELFSTTELTKIQLKEIYNTTKGNPGYLASLKRIILSGGNINEILENLQNIIPNLFQYEWKSVNINDENTILLLSILAHDRKRHCLKDTATLMGFEEKVIIEIINSISFIVYDEQTDNIQFVSESFRKFVAEETKKHKADVVSLQIERLKSNPDSEDSLNELPHYFEQSEKYEELISYLSPDYLLKILENTQSLTLLGERAALGVKAAKKLNKEIELIRFALQRSTFLEMSTSGIWRSEIEAMLELDDFGNAISIAQKSILKEERFHLLVIIAKARRQKGLAPDLDIVEQIKVLYNSLDIDKLGEKAIEISKDLIFSEPEMAIDLLERAMKVGHDPNAMDWALAKLSLVTYNGNGDNDVFRNIQAKIKDPMARSFSSALSIMFRNYSVEGILQEVEKIDEMSVKMHLLRIWCLENATNCEAYKIVDFAIRLALKTSEFTPNASLFRELATPLPMIKDINILANLLLTFDGQIDNLQNVGPTEEVIRLQIILAESQSKLNLDAQASNRIVDIYFKITSLEDIIIKATCFSFLIAVLENNPELKQLVETKEGLVSIMEKELEDTIKILLENTANHFHAIKGVIGALSKVKNEEIFKLTQNLNTQYCRDLALFECIENYIDQPLIKINIEYILNILKDFYDYELRDDIFLKILKVYGDSEEDFEKISFEPIQELFRRIPMINNLGDRCEAYCLSLKVFSKNKNVDGKELQKIVEILVKDWDKIDSGLYKIEIGFRIVRLLASTSKEYATAFLRLSENSRNSIIVESPSITYAYIMCINLMLRAFAGLLPKHLETTDDLIRITSIINNITSYGDQVGLWAELSLRAYSVERHDISKKIVSEKIIPILEKIPENDVDYYYRVLLKISSAIYLNFKQIAIEKLSNVKQPFRDRIYNEIVKYILSKKTRLDPIDDSTVNSNNITYEDLIEVCSILNEVETDANIYFTIEKIVEVLNSRDTKKVFTKNQRGDICKKLEEIIKVKLPNDKYIKHEGFKIVAEAQIGLISGKNYFPFWEDLIARANNLPNKADQVFVLCILLDCIPSRFDTHKDNIFSSVEEKIKNIPDKLDMLSHFEHLIEYIWKDYPAKAKEYLSLAIKSCSNSDDPEIISPHVRIIDLAYRLDSEYANSLASMLDDDPARIEIRSSMNRRVQVLELKKKMLNQLEISHLNHKSKMNLPEASWMLLQSLNSGKIETIQTEKNRNLIEVASDLPLRESYPTLSWIIENAISRFSRTDQSKTYIRPLFDKILLSCELTGTMTANSLKKSQIAHLHIGQTQNENVIIVAEGEREKAIEFIKVWMEEHVEDFLIIADKYFTPADLDILKILLSVNPSINVRILSGLKKHKEDHINEPYNYEYERQWRNISEQTPPATEIIIIGTQDSGESPLHDRWMLSKDSILTLGTSFNSLGRTCTSKLEISGKDKAVIQEEAIAGYLTRKIKDHQGKRLYYQTFDI